MIDFQLPKNEDIMQQDQLSKITYIITRTKGRQYKFYSWDGKKQKELGLEDIPVKFLKKIEKAWEKET